MADNKVSAALSAADRDTVLAAIATIRQKLPFLIHLTTDDRRSIVKLGDRSRAFVSKALDVANQNPNMLPPSFDVPEMRQDWNLFEDLQPILLALNQLQGLVEDTVMEAGSEAYAAALAIYEFTKTATNRSALEAAAGELGQRFTRKTRGAAAVASEASATPKP